MKKDDAYYPSATNMSKYWKYLGYLVEYLKYGDWKSVKSSLKFVFKGQPESERRYANSRLGKFLIRKGTTDFQFINYAYERQIRNYILKHQDEFDTYIDIGACIGEYCVWIASLGKEVFAFEPVPANYEGLMENVSLNKQEKSITAFNVGLGKHEGMVHFDILSTVTGSSHISKDQDQEGNVKIEVLDKVLDESIIKDESAVLMKLDVEGMEVDVLTGAKQFLKRIPNLSIIFEHSFAGTEEIKSFLNTTGSYDYKYLDKYNIIAVKE